MSAFYRVGGIGVVEYVPRVFADGQNVQLAADHAVINGDKHQSERALGRRHYLVYRIALSGNEIDLLKRYLSGDCGSVLFYGHFRQLALRALAVPRFLIKFRCARADRKGSGIACGKVVGVNIYGIRPLLFRDKRLPGNFRRLAGIPVFGLSNRRAAYRKAHLVAGRIRVVQTGNGQAAALREYSVDEQRIVAAGVFHLEQRQSAGRQSVEKALIIAHLRRRYFYVLPDVGSQFGLAVAEICRSDRSGKIGYIHPYRYKAVVTVLIHYGRIVARREIKSRSFSRAGGQICRACRLRGSPQRRQRRLHGYRSVFAVYGLYQAFIVQAVKLVDL